jgi:hypothetical protein
MATPISRLTNNSNAHNTLNLPPSVPIFFQMSPDAPSGDMRGISGIPYRVLINNVEVGSGATPQDGRIDVRVPPGGESLLQLLTAQGGDVVAEYNITVNNDRLDPVDSIRGQQQRLRMLGYQIGNDGEGNGVNLPADDEPNQDFERSVLDFQADQSDPSDFGLVPDAVVGQKTQSALSSRAKA